MGYSPRGHIESETTERQTLSLSVLKSSLPPDPVRTELHG